MRSILAAALVLGAVTCTGPGVARAGRGGPWSSYERWVRPPAPWPLERRVLRAVKAWAGRRSLRFEDDARLALVARAALGEVPRTAAGRLDLDPLRTRARRLGLTDGELAAIALRLPESVDVMAAVSAELDARLGTLQPNRVGVAARLEGPDRVVLVVLSRRLVRLLPLPAQLRRGQRATIGGTLVQRPREGRVTLVVARPGAEVRKRVLPLDGASFEGVVDAGTVPGIVDVQLLLDRGRGPEIAAQLQIGVERQPYAQPAIPAEAEEAAAGELAEPGALAPRLAALVLGAREAAKVALPGVSAALDEVASAHAADMREAGFFAHVSPRTGTLTQRLAARGVRAGRALENLARAEDVDAVLRQWLASPSHRANLFDPDVDAFGVGVATTPSGEVLAVLVLASAAEAGDPGELAARALARINAERLHGGLAPLAWDDELGRIAAAHSQAVAGGDRSGDGNLVGRVLAELEVGAAAADLLVAPSLGAVLEARNLRGAFERAGVGVAASGDGRLCITVLFAAE